MVEVKVHVCSASAKADLVWGMVAITEQSLGGYRNKIGFMYYYTDITQKTAAPPRSTPRPATHRVLGREPPGARPAGRCSLAKVGGPKEARSRELLVSWSTGVTVLSSTVHSRVHSSRGPAGLSCTAATTTAVIDCTAATTLAANGCTTAPTTALIGCAAATTTASIGCATATTIAAIGCTWRSPALLLAPSCSFSLLLAPSRSTPKAAEPPRTDTATPPRTWSRHTYPPPPPQAPGHARGEARRSRAWMRPGGCNRGCSRAATAAVTRVRPPPAQAEGPARPGPARRSTACRARSDWGGAGAPRYFLLTLGPDEYWRPSAPNLHRLGATAYPRRPVQTTRIRVTGLRR